VIDDGDGQRAHRRVVARRDRRRAAPVSCDRGPRCPTISYMMHTPWADLRRLMPRIDVATFCTEVVAGRDRPGLVVDLSPEGARLERPYLGGPSPRELVLELEVPEIDEVIWAKGEVCFDQVRQAPRGLGGPLGLVRTTGIRLVSAAVRDLRLLRECVIETYRAQRAQATVDEQLAVASCYARG
jgi:hypothetical protein